MYNRRNRFGCKNIYLVLLMAIALTGPFITASAQENGTDQQAKKVEQEQKVRDFYQKGVQHLKKEELEAAYTQFQRAIEAARELDPEVRGSLLRWLWHSSSTRLFDKMLEDPQLRHAAERIMELTKGAYWTWKMDESRVSRLVQNLTADDYKLQLESQRQLISAGQYAAPSLIEALKSDNSTMRSQAILTLSEMDSRVLLPVVEALESDSHLQRKNAAIVLGNLEDPRALPALKRTLENDSNEIVRGEAHQAIVKILKARLPAYLRNRAQNKEDATVKEVVQDTDGASIRLDRSPPETQDHTHNWDEVKAHVQLSPEEQQKERAKSNGQMAENEWPGARELGLQNIYVDQQGHKYIKHIHESAKRRMKEKKKKEISVDPHRHYLKNISGLPSKLEQYVNPWRALKINLFDPQTVENLVSSPKLFHRLAESYYLTEPPVMNRLYGDALVWSWNDEKQRAESRAVPEFMFNEELAVQACLDGLEVNVDYRPLWPLVVNAYFSMFNESDLMLTRGEKYVNYNVLSQKSLERMQKDLRTRDQMGLPGQLVNTEVLYAALSQSIDDQKPLIAVSNLTVLEEFLDPSRLPASDLTGWKQKEALAYPMLKALGYGDRRVRYRAASMLVNSDPQEKFLHWNRVIPVLSESVSTGGIRQVTYASRNQEQVNRFRHIMRDPNLRANVQVARNAKELIRYSKAAPVSDLIVVDGDLLGTVMYSFDVPGRDASYQQRVIDSLKDDIRTRAIPLVAVADSATQKAELEKTFGDRIDVVIEGPVNVERMLELFRDQKEKLVKGNIELEIKALAERLALRSARALKSINPEDTIFTNYRGAVSALMGTLKDRPDDLRVTAADALGRFADSRAIRPLVRALNRQGDSVPVRVAAGKALAKIFQKNRTTPNDQTLSLLIQNASKGPIKVQIASSRAFGEANISEEKRVQLLRKIRSNQIGTSSASSDNPSE